MKPVWGGILLGLSLIILFSDQNVNSYTLAIGAVIMSFGIGLIAEGIFDNKKNTD